MAKAYFIAGTDTGVGKTAVAKGLLAAANRRGLSTAAIKPVASGCERTAEGLRNDDALGLQEVMSLPLPYQQVNPVAFEPAIAPHIAAARAHKILNAAQLAGFCRGVLSQRADFTVVEGAGGWLVPLNPVETLADLAAQLKLPVILVVAVRLGGLNHALLPAAAVARPLLGAVPYVAGVSPEAVAGHLDLELLA